MLPKMITTPLGRIVFVISILFLDNVGAEQFGLFTYREVDGTVEITSFPKDLEIHVDIPAEIDGKPVVAITGNGAADPNEFEGAFSFSQITSVTIPESVTTIGRFAFGVCSKLTSVSFPDSVTTVEDEAFYQCHGLIRVTLGEGVTSIGKLAFFRNSSLAFLNLPDSLTTVGERAFEGCAFTSLSFGQNLASLGTGTFFRCTKLRSIVFRSTLGFMGAYCFGDCDALIAAVFLGNAPGVSGSSNVFMRADPGFVVYFLNGNTGFTTPTWVPVNTPGGSDSYATQPLERVLTNSEVWLLGHGLPMNTDLNLDPNGDGVNHLMAYALALDPNAGFISNPLEPTLDSDVLGITFFAGRDDVAYTPQTSNDLDNWTTDGLTLSELDSEGRRTASVSRSQPRRYLRLLLALDEP
jgi:hypothetical protein